MGMCMDQRHSIVTQNAKVLISTVSKEQCYCLSGSQTDWQIVLQGKGSVNWFLPRYSAAQMQHRLTRVQTI